MYCDTASLERSSSVWVGVAVKPHLSSHIPNIFAGNILLKAGGEIRLKAFYNLFLSDIKAKI